MRLIPRPVHGVIDYIFGLFLLVSPWLFKYLHTQSVSADLAIIFGAAILVYTSLTNFEAGIVRLIPFPAHLVLDVIVGAALLASPVIFAVTGIPAVVFVVVGISKLVTAAITRGEGRSSGRPGFPTWS